MKCGLTLFLALFIVAANAQVKLLTLNELDQRLSKGKDTTYVINFWATWCGPCVAELPNFEKLQKLNLQKPVKVILISLDFKSKLNVAVVPFVKKHRIKSEVYVINEPNQQLLIDKIDQKWSGAIPATLIINTNKKYRAFYEKEFSYIELSESIKTIN